jgi:hypothetical protein
MLFIRFFCWDSKNLRDSKRILRHSVGRLPSSFDEVTRQSERSRSPRSLQGLKLS